MPTDPSRMTASSPPARRRVRNPRRIARYLLLVLVPLAVLIKTCADERLTPQDPPGFAFTRPAGWSYLTETQIRPTGDRIRFSSSDVGAAFAAGHTAPLFAITKYAPPYDGLNPVIGVNLAWERGDEIAPPQVVLQRSVDEVQERSGEGLVVLEAITTTELAGLPAARVLLGTRGAPAAGKHADRLTVLALAHGRLSFLVAASGAAFGADAIDGELLAFIDSLEVDARPAAAPP